MRITQDLRDYAEAHGVSPEQAIELGMTEKAVEFVTSGADLYQSDDSAPNAPGLARTRFCGALSVNNPGERLGFQVSVRGFMNHGGVAGDRLKLPGTAAVTSGEASDVAGVPTSRACPHPSGEERDPGMPMSGEIIRTTRGEEKGVEETGEPRFSMSVIRNAH